MASFDEFLAQSRTEENVKTAQPVDSPLDTFLTGQDEATKLKLSVDNAAATDAARAARVIRLQTRTGLAPEFLNRNLDTVESAANAQGFDPVQYRKDNPAAASWLAEHPDHAAAAKDDYQQLGYVEKLLNNLKIGWAGLQQERAVLSLSQNVQAMTMQETSREWERRYGLTPGLTPEQHIALKAERMGRIVEASKSIAGRYGEIQGIPQDPVVMAAANAAAKAAADWRDFSKLSASFADFWHWFTQKPFEFTMAMGAQSLPQMAPAYAMAVPAGAFLGLPGVALAIGAGSFQVDYANNVLQAFQMEGVDISDPEAVWMATHDQALMGRVGASAFAHALPVALLDVASAGVAGRTLGPTARLAGRPIVRQAVNVSLQAPIQGALGAAGETIGEVAAGQPPQPGQIMAEFFGEFAMAPGEVAGVGYAAGKNAYREVAAAKERQAYFEALGTGVTDSKTFQRLPEAIQEIVARATKNGPIETLYVPVDAFTTYFQKEGVDPREAMKALTGQPEAYDLAKQTGGDVPIPTAVYAAQIAPTPANAFFAREVRTAPEAMNGREAEEWYTARVAETKAAAAKAADVEAGVPQVGQAITGQLIASGFDPHVAEQYAALFEARYRARAERRGLGETPIGLFEQQNLNIQRVLPEVLTRMKSTGEMDALLDRIRRGDLPAQGKMYGQSLAEMLREAGGVQDQGGELSAMDLDAVLRPFQKKLINPEGLTLERATERAVEGGYLPEQDINALLELLAQEARGQPAYAVGKEDVGLVGVQQKLEMLAHALEQRNLDVGTMSNEQIKQALGEAIAPQPVAVGPTFAQRIGQLTVPQLLEQIGFELHDLTGIVSVGKTEQPTRTERLHASEVYRQAMEWLRTMAPTDPLRANLAEQVGQLREALKQAGRPLVYYQGAEQPWARPFYSKALAIVEAKMPNRATGDDVGRLLKAQGVKPDEMKWLGLDDFLAGKPSVTKAEVTAFIKANEVTLAEKVLGAKAYTEEEFYRQFAGQIHLLNLAGWQVTMDPLNAQRLGFMERGDPDAEIVPIEDIPWPEITATQARAYLGDPATWSIVARNRKVIEGLTSLTLEDVKEFATRVYYYGEVEAYFYLTKDGRYAVPVGGDEAVVDSLGEAEIKLYDWVRSETGPVLSDNSARAIAERLQTEAAKGGVKATKFQQWQLPSGENYREILLTLNRKLPTVATPTLVDALYDQIQNKRELHVISQDEADVAKRDIALWERGELVYPSWLEQSPWNLRSYFTGEQFTGGHWGVKDVLVHVRANDRVDAEGKRVLFLEEIQSDWHQRGRRQGYGRGGEEKAVPEAPFKKTWQEVALKRMLRYAAEGNYDTLAFTTGEQQAARYDLSKQVDMVNATRLATGQYAIVAMAPGRPVAIIDEAFPAEQLPEVVGKDLADKIIADLHDMTDQTSRSYSGLDLKVGGEGMKGFYDVIVPRYLNQYGKKWGAHVGDITLPEQRVQELPAPVAAALTVHAIPITPAMKQAVLYEGQPLFQAGAENAKGSITFGKGRIDVRLLEKADLSTFIHETGHMYLDELIADAATAGTPPQLRDDLDTVLKWMGLEVRSANGEQAVRAAVLDVQHEQFARGFEAYTLEGKSPSQAMREVFARFRQWLIQVYRLLTFQGGATPENIAQVRDVKLTNAVREVMDRMLATENEIAAAEAEAEIVPLFTKAEDAGMSEKEFGLYRDTITKASLSAREQMQARMMAQYRREQEAWWKAERETVKGQVTAEVNAQPAYIALSVMQKGVMPDGSALPDGVRAVKLDKQALVDQFGKDFLKRLPRGIRASPGVNPDSAAAQFGFQTGEALVMAVVNARPKAPLIEAETDLRMQREHGDLRFDGTAAEAARAALANEDREKLIAVELAALRRKQLAVAPFAKEAARQATAQAEQAGATDVLAGGEAAAKAAVVAQRLAAHTALAQVPPMAVLQRVAAERIEQQVVRSIRPYEYFTAARKASRAASVALGKGDMRAAIVGKQQELLNLALSREAASAKEETQAIYAHMVGLRKKSAQERLGKAGADYREQVNALLERYEFAQVSLRAVEARASLAEWVAQKEADGETLGEEFFVPPSVLREARRVNYKDIPYGELLGIRDTIKQIEHFARLKNKLLKAQDVREKDALREQLIATLSMNVKDKGPPPLTIASKTTLEKASALAQAFDASLIKMEQVVEFLDGGPTGPWHAAFWNGAVEAQAAEYDYTDKITAKLTAAIVGMSPEIRNRMLETVKIDGIDRPVARKELLGVAMNVGNQSNHDKLLKGMNWSEAQLVQMLDHLTQEEWTFVQGVWDLLEGMKPDIWALQKRLTGIEPEAVVPREVLTKYGAFRGGYYPIMYDPILAKQGERQLSDTIGSLSNQSRATLQSGYRKARVEGFARPFNLNVDHLPMHLAGVIKDLTHREWMIDARWITDDPAIRKALQRHLGDAGTRRMGEWVTQTVNDRNTASMASMQIWEKMIEGFRYNVMIVMMGFKFSTIFSQLAGVAPAIEVIGGKELDGIKWFGKGLGEFLRQPRAAYDFMVAQSGEMRHRIMTRDRDMRDKLRQLEGKSDLWSEIQSASLQAIGWSELMISAPSWYGAYYKALDAGLSDEDAVRMGERAVRLGQGASGAKDLSAVMARSNQLMKVLTMFYTPFSALYGRLRAIGHDVEGLHDVPQIAFRLFMTIAVAGTLGAMASGQGPREKKDETWLGWWLANMALYPFLAIPMMRDAMTAILQGYSYQFTPLAKVWESRIAAARDLEKTIEGEKEWSDYIEKAYKAFEFLVGLPTEQLLITGKYLRDLYTGNAKPDNIFQFAHDLFYRRPKEE